MKKLQNGNLKLAIQKNGRLTQDTVDFLRASGLEFENSKQGLFSLCRNFPLEILFVRDDDIPGYVESGTVDIGIVGLNIINELSPMIKTLLKLRYGLCSLCVAVSTDSKISSLSDLAGKTIATSYPNSTKRIFANQNINVVEISGSVEIAPILGVADAIVDLVSTGSTLTLNDLRIVKKLFDSEAVVVSNNNALSNQKKIILINKLLTRFKGVLSAKSYKYVMMNAPEKILPKITQAVSGLKSPTISPLAKKGWISIQTVIKEDIFWETIEKLKKIGAKSILVLPIEKLII